jgi:cytochrome c oxidase subunit 3
MLISYLSIKTKKVFLIINNEHKKNFCNKIEKKNLGSNQKEKFIINEYNAYEKEKEQQKNEESFIEIQINKNEVEKIEKKVLKVLAEKHKAPRVIFKMKKKRHPFHIVQPSPWPFFCAMSLTGVFLSFFALMNPSYYTSFELQVYSIFILFSFLFSFSLWIRDITRECTYELDTHNLRTQRGLSIGFLLFLLSETMFFVSFFWAFLHCSLSPSIWIHLTWPPKGIKVLNHLKEPLLNTIILVSSGFTINSAYVFIKTALKHEVLLELCKIEFSYKVFFKNFFKTKDYISKLKFLYGYLILNYAGHFFYILTLFYGCLFLRIQFKEYQHASFDISDGIYGSCFYMLTGFHGLHVILGLIYLFFQFIRYCIGHFSLYYIVNKQTVMLGLQTAIWYWHFVDVIWLILYLVVYVWGSANFSNAFSMPESSIEAVAYDLFKDKFAIKKNRE